MATIIEFDDALGHEQDNQDDGQSEQQKAVMADFPEPFVADRDDERAHDYTGESAEPPTESMTMTIKKNSVPRIFGVTTVT